MMMGRWLKIFLIKIIKMEKLRHVYRMQETNRREKYELQ